MQVVGGKLAPIFSLRGPTVETKKSPLEAGLGVGAWRLGL